MIIAKCPACAAPLAHDSPPCVRCSTRYCSETCRYDHWRRGHKHICKIISSRGGPEQIYAEKKYKEAVAEAVEACAADTKGQTCYICTQALHWKTKEGLVRGCACRGTAGFAHVSCLAEQAKILLAEVRENNLGTKAFNARWDRWYTCSLCEQEYHGVVACALGWACWKTYLGRPERDAARRYAMTQLGNGLSAAKHYKDALSVMEAELSMKQRVGFPEVYIHCTQINLASTYTKLGRFDDALEANRDAYFAVLKTCGEEHIYTLESVNHYSSSLIDLKRFKQARSLLRKTMPIARRVLGESNELTLKMRRVYGKVLYMNNCATLDHLREAVTTLEDVERTARRVLGGAHPLTSAIEGDLRDARAALAARETPSSGSA